MASMSTVEFTCGHTELHHIEGGLGEGFVYDSEDPCWPCRWPTDYDHSLGVEDLELLRLAGEPGLEILSQPLTVMSIDLANAIIQYMKEAVAAACESQALL